MSLLLDAEDIKDDLNNLNKFNVNDNNDGFPLIKQLSCKIRGKSFEFVIENFSDKIMVIITSKGRIGQIVRASMSRSHLTGKTHFNNTTLLGMIDDFSIINLLSRQLIEQISLKSNKSLILGVGFDKNISNDYLPLILKCIDQIKFW